MSRADCGVIRPTLSDDYGLTFASGNPMASSSAGNFLSATSLWISVAANEG
jgi:hypothetical protein